MKSWTNWLIEFIMILVLIGSMSNDNVYNYGTNIYERLEFLIIIGESLLQAKT